MPDTAVRVLIHGIVQCVGYRAWCAGKADELGLSGWVRNRATGEVEAVFSGPEDRIAAMLDACCGGPFGARVDHVEEERAPPRAGGFELRESV